MHAFASFNGLVRDASRIRLPAVSSAAFYGRGVFTTVAVYNAAPFQWGKHWRRLADNAQRTGVDLSEFTEENVGKLLAETIERNRFRAGRARLTFFSRSPGGGGALWQIESDRRRTDLLITSADFRPAPPELRLTVSPFRINSASPLAGVKSCNYLEHLLALENARAAGFDEAVRLNEKNEVVSAAAANVFWAKDGEIFTPPLSAGALDGTTRSFVLDNFPVRERRAGAGELSEADEVFLTSAGVGAARAKSFGERNFENSDVFPGIGELFNKFALEK